MPNNVRNILEIHCPDEGAMGKIKKVIFDHNEINEKVFTMKKLLPMPEGSSGQTGYTDYGYDWCCAIWGTKWDVYDYNIMESGDTILIYYSTAWSPNYRWGESLCKFIQGIIRFDESEKINSIYVKHRFHDYPMDFGGILEWKPKIAPEYKSFSFMEYAELYDKKLFEIMTDLEKRMKENPDKIVVIKGY